MFPYIVRRVFVMILMLTILSIITFLLFNAVPTDPAMLTCGKTCTPEIVAANRIRLGLDQPLYVQYIDWIKGIFVGRTYGSGSATFECSTPCLGYSFRNGEEVTTMIVDAISVTGIAGALTPMPGGTGIMTVACLMENTVNAAAMQGVRV